VKSLTQEVVSAFETVHLLRCKTEDMDRCHANHGELIRQSNALEEYQVQNNELIHQLQVVKDGIEAEFAKRLDKARNDWLVGTKADLAQRLDEVRNDWLVVKDLPDNSLAEWINTVFDVAIKFVQEAE